MNGKCPKCGRALSPIGEYVNKPKDPTKLCCPICRKVYSRSDATVQTSSENENRTIEDIYAEDGGIPW